MKKRTRTMRIDDELWIEVDNAGKKLRPKEKRTEFFEKAAWERLDKIKKEMEKNKNYPGNIPPNSISSPEPL